MSPFSSESEYEARHKAWRDLADDTRTRVVAKVRELARESEQLGELLSVEAKEIFRAARELAWLDATVGDTVPIPEDSARRLRLLQAECSKWRLAASIRMAMLLRKFWLAVAEVAEEAGRAFLRVAAGQALSYIRGQEGTS
jgi:hypothetical protein